MKPQKQKKLPVLKGEPVFIYTSNCCNANAQKAPCMYVDKKTAETQGLGTFRCSGCRKVAKVTRSKNKLDKDDQVV
jgi:hypothetical protein